MSIAHKTLPFAVAAVLFAGSAAVAQTGGGDVPTDAKKQGTMENGPSSTGMSKGEAQGEMKKGEMKKGGMMKKEGGMKKDDKM